MKTWILVVIFLVLGTVAGLGMTAWELMRAPDDFGSLTPGKSDQYQTGTTLLDVARPKVVVEGVEDYDFDTMERGARAEHVFVFKNAGEGTLRLAKGESTCTCTVGELDKKLVPPGESTEVKLEWIASGESRHFRQTVTILTNDPLRPRINLSVHGAVTQKIRLDPKILVFTGVSAGETQTDHVDVFNYKEANFKIVEEPKLVNQDTANHFDVQIGPIPPRELEQEPYVKSGVRVSVTIQGGLPIGPIHQTIRMRTNAPEAPILDIHVGGKIGSDVSIVGSRERYDAERNIVMIGHVDRDQGAVADLLLLVKGPHRHETNVSVGEVSSHVLRVTVGPRSEINEGKVIKFPITVRVPKGCDPVQHLGSEQGKLAKITLETTHPKVLKVPIYVRFAVQ